MDEQCDDEQFPTTDKNTQTEAFGPPESPEDRPKDGAYVSLWDKIIMAPTTFGAMLPQGLFGGLWSQNIFTRYAPKMPLAVDMTLDAFFAFSAFIGKYAIVRFYNTEGGKDLGRAGPGQYWDNIFRGKFSFYDVLNQFASIPASLTFSYIGKLSMDGIAELLKSFGNATASHIAEYFAWSPLQIPFMVMPFLCNIRGFPHVHNGALSLLQDALYYLAENPEYRKTVRDLSLQMEAVRKYIKMLFESKDPDQIEKARQFLKKCGIDEKTDIQALREKLLAAAQDQDIPAECFNDPETWRTFIAKHSLSLIAMGITIAGFYNFYTLGIEAALYFGAGHLWQYLPSVSGGMCFSSMIGMATGVYRTVSGIFDYWNNERVPVDILPLRSKIFNQVLTSLASITGVTPNAYQSMVLVKQSFLWVLAAAFASAGVEYGGFTDLIQRGQINAVINAKTEAGATAKEFYTLDEQLLKASNLSDFYDEVRKRSNITHEEIIKLLNIYNRNNPEVCIQIEPQHKIINDEVHIQINDSKFTNTSINTETEKKPAPAASSYLPQQYRPSAAKTWEYMTKATNTVSHAISSFKNCCSGFWESDSPRNTVEVADESSRQFKNNSSENTRSSWCDLRIC